jgi:hypothetical protein
MKRSAIRDSDPDRRATVANTGVNGAKAKERIFGIAPAALTADEATYILDFRDADALRDRAAAALVERKARLCAKGIGAGA